jgi:hypothetical protein
MTTATTTTATTTTARDLSALLSDLLRREADFDRRRLWLDLGHGSLFYFLHRELGLSRGAAHYRKTAAQLVQRFPQVVEPLRDGRLCITSVVELAKVLTEGNVSEVLPRFFHRSKREAMAVAVAIRPHDAPPHRVVVTAARTAAKPSRAEEDGAPPTLPGARDLGQAAVQPDEPGEASKAPAGPLGPTSSHVASPPVAPRDSAEPLTAELRRLHVTVSARFLEKLESAREALSHARPGAGAEEVLEAGLDLLLARQARRRGLVEKPRRPVGREARAGADYVSAAVRREVWTRDAGRCQWPLAWGGRCGSGLRVEIDHVIPRARGGPSTASNLRLLCRVHNDLAARREFGDEWMDAFRRGGAASADRRGGSASAESDRLPPPAPG